MRQYCVIHPLHLKHYHFPLLFTLEHHHLSAYLDMPYLGNILLGLMLSRSTWKPSNLTLSWSKWTLSVLYMKHFQICITLAIFTHSKPFDFLTAVCTNMTHKSNVTPKFIEVCDLCESYDETSYVFPKIESYKYMAHFCKIS